MTGLQSAGFIAVTRIIVPSAVIGEIQNHMRRAGLLGQEAVGFWAGELRGDHFQVTDSVLPRQHPVYGPDDGIGVVIPGDELFRLNVWLHRCRLSLIAQVHSHPGAAFHSDTDDAFATVARAGALSIVVPHFAMGEFELSQVAVHRLSVRGRWVNVAPEEASALIEIES